MLKQLVKFDCEHECTIEVGGLVEGRMFKGDARTCPECNAIKFVTFADVPYRDDDVDTPPEPPKDGRMVEGQIPIMKWD